MLRAVISVPDNTRQPGSLRIEANEPELLPPRRRSNGDAACAVPTVHSRPHRRTADGKQPCYSGFLAPVWHLVHHLPCELSEAQRFWQGIQRRRIQVSEGR